MRQEQATDGFRLAYDRPLERPRELAAAIIAALGSGPAGALSGAGERFRMAGNNPAPSSVAPSGIMP